jgi:Txe/YoeB family toxin of Txe-Axe toxin-antitoxin module
MKVTAIINDDLVKTVMELSHSKNITEGLVIALKDYVYRKKIEELITDFDNDPLQFKHSPEEIRKTNRRKRV